MSTSARIGLIVPCDLTLDHEYPEYITEGTVHITRTGFHDGGLTRDFIEGVASPAELHYAAKSLTKIEPEVISFACTSGSFLHGLPGERLIRSVLSQAGAKVAQTTSGALLDAVKALGVRRLGIATPYPAEVGNLLADFLGAAGIEVMTRHHAELPDVIGPIAQDEVTEMAEEAAVGGPDAVFLACTGVPTLHEVVPLEDALRVPVLTANGVTMWAAAGAAGAKPAPLGSRLSEVAWTSR